VEPAAVESEQAPAAAEAAIAPETTTESPVTADEAPQAPAAEAAGAEQETGDAPNW
jgi:hypothetical protein